MSKLLKDATEQTLDPSEALFAKGYAAFSQQHEFWVVVGRGAFAFRWGPYDGPAAGKILEWGVKNRVAVSLVGNMGSDFDYELAKDFGLRLVLPEDRKTPAGLIRKLFASIRRRNGNG
jgi:hypothetical protein